MSPSFEQVVIFLIEKGAHVYLYVRTTLLISMHFKFYASLSFVVLSDTVIMDDLSLYAFISFVILAFDAPAIFATFVFNASGFCCYLSYCFKTLSPSGSSTPTAAPNSLSIWISASISSSKILLIFRMKLLNSSKEKLFGFLFDMFLGFDRALSIKGAFSPFVRTSNWLKCYWLFGTSLSLNIFGGWIGVRALTFDERLHKITIDDRIIIYFKFISSNVKQIHHWSIRYDLQSM